MAHFLILSCGKVYSTSAEFSALVVYVANLQYTSLLILMKTILCGQETLTVIDF